MVASKGDEEEDGKVRAGASATKESEVEEAAAPKQKKPRLAVRQFWFLLPSTLHTHLSSPSFSPLPLSLTHTLSLS
jgi:hypothetical protein